MRITSLLRTATLAFALAGVFGATSPVFAASDQSQAGNGQQVTKANPYDSQDFVVPANEVNP